MTWNSHMGFKGNNKYICMVVMCCMSSQPQQPHLQGWRGQIVSQEWHRKIEAPSTEASLCQDSFQMKPEGKSIMGRRLIRTMLSLSKKEHQGREGVSHDNLGGHQLQVCHVSTNEGISGKVSMSAPSAFPACFTACSKLSTFTVFASIVKTLSVFRTQQQLQGCSKQHGCCGTTLCPKTICCSTGPHNLEIMRV